MTRHSKTPIGGATANEMAALLHGPNAKPRGNRYLSDRTRNAYAKFDLHNGGAIAPKLAAHKRRMRALLNARKAGTYVLPADHDYPIPTGERPKPSILELPTEIFGHNDNFDSKSAEYLNTDTYNFGGMAPVKETGKSKFRAYLDETDSVELLAAQYAYHYKRTHTQRAMNYRDYSHPMPIDRSYYIKWTANSLLNAWEPPTYEYDN